jgi:hypothetical protein
VKYDPTATAYIMMCESDMTPKLPRHSLSRYARVTVTKEHISQLLKNNDPFVRKFAARNPIASSEDIHQALSDPNINVNIFAAMNPSANKEHLERALNHPDPKHAQWMRDTAMENPAYKKHFPNGHQ